MSSGSAIANAWNSSAVKVEWRRISASISSGVIPGKRPTAAAITAPSGSMRSWIVTRSMISRGTRRSAAADALFMTRSNSRDCKLVRGTAELLDPLGEPSPRHGTVGSERPGDRQGGARRRVIDGPETPERDRPEIRERLTIESLDLVKCGLSRHPIRLSLAGLERTIPLTHQGPASSSKRFQSRPYEPGLPNHHDQPVEGDDMPVRSDDRHGHKHGGAHQGAETPPAQIWQCR